MAQANGYIGRFAPSPTGPLHLGSLFTAVASFLDARHNQGSWLLRIDDLDIPRNIPGADSNILKCLESFGLIWDGEVDYQSRHKAEYLAALESLQEQKQLYPCVCSRRILADSPKIYPGNCRERAQDPEVPHALRVKVSDASIRFTDTLQGEISQNLATAHGDFIVKRKDGIIAYQLACVVDDKRQNITHVVRGLDLLDSTPKQLFLQRLLDYPTPGFTHIPIIVDENGNKLSKQTRAQAVDIQQAGSTLFGLLSLLQQEPPLDLRHAPVACILEWGITHWHPENLQKKSQLAAAFPLK